METGIKETKELLEGLGKLAKAVAKIAEDGKIKPDDLQVVLDLAKDVNVLAEAVKGAKEIPSELKDLDEKEVMEIIACLYAISKEISA